MQRVCVHASLVPLYCGSQEVVKLGSDQPETLQVLTRSKGCRLDSHGLIIFAAAAFTQHQFHIPSQKNSPRPFRTKRRKTKKEDTEFGKEKKKGEGGIFPQQIQTRGEKKHEREIKHPIFQREKYKPVGIIFILLMLFVNHPGKDFLFPAKNKQNK